MKSLIKIVKYLLQPWSTIYKPQISSFAKAVIVGCSVSFILWAVGWTLFSSSADLRSADLDNRSVVSVLLSPDYRFIGAVPEQWIAIGTCDGLLRPSPGVSELRASLPNIDGTYCKGWIETKKPGSIFKPWLTYSSWSATKYRYVPGKFARVLGSSRSDALERVKEVWVGAASSLLTPLIVLIVMQMGVLVGYQYFRRSPETNITDEDIS